MAAVRDPRSPIGRHSTSTRLPVGCWLAASLAAARSHNNDNNNNYCRGIMMIRHRITCNCSKQHGSCVCVCLFCRSQQRVENFEKLHCFVMSIWLVRAVLFNNGFMVNLVRRGRFVRKWEFFLVAPVVVKLRHGVYAAVTRLF